MDKNYRQYNKRASMDSIEVPDVDKIKKLSDKKFKGSGVNRTADEIFDGEKFNKAGEFDRATKTYDDPTKHKEEDDEDDFLEDAAAMPAQAATGLSKGVKVGDSYVKRSKIIKTVVAVIIVLVLMVFFFPPLFFNDADKSVARYDDNVFKTMGMTDFKTYALSNYSVYNEEAFGSELSSSYRFADIVFNIKNPSPFEIKIPQYEISHVSSEYDNAVCYATSVTTGISICPWRSSSSELSVRLTGGRATFMARVTASSLSPDSSQSSLTVGSLPCCMENRSRSLTRRMESSFMLRDTFIVPPSRKSLFISPNITGTA